MEQGSRGALMPQWPLLMVVIVLASWPAVCSAHQDRPTTLSDSCAPGWSGPLCSQPECIPRCANDGNCTSPGVCNCLSGWSGGRCQDAVCTPQCENGGFCSKPGACVCASGWTGAQCAARALVGVPSLLLALAFVMITVSSHTIGQVVPSLRMPLISGYLLVGVLAGPHVLNLMPENEIRDLDFIDKLALSYISFAAGSKLYVKRLRNRAPSIARVTGGLVFFEILLGTLVFLWMCQNDSLVPFARGMSSTEKGAVSLLVGTLLVARSPASCIAIIDEVRAAGPQTLLLLGTTIVSDISVILIFSFTLLVAESTFETGSRGTGGGPGAVFGLSLARILISVTVGALFGFVMPPIIWGWQDRFRPFTTTVLMRLKVVQAVLFFALCLLIFLAEQYVDVVVEPLMVSMASGYVIVNHTHHRKKLLKLLHWLAPVVYVSFFTLTGAALALDALGRTIGVSIILVVVRGVGIFLGSYIGGRAAKEPERSNRSAWLGYITQAGVSLGLAKKIHLSFPQWGGDFATVMVSAVIINQVIGPPLLKHAIRYVHEDNKVKATGDVAVIFGDTDDPEVRWVSYLLRLRGWKAKVVDGQQFLSRGKPRTTAKDMRLQEKSPRAAVRARKQRGANQELGLMSSREHEHEYSEDNSGGASKRDHTSSRRQNDSDNDNDNDKDKDEDEDDDDDDEHRNSDANDGGSTGKTEEEEEDEEEEKEEDVSDEQTTLGAGIQPRSSSGVVGPNAPGAWRLRDDVTAAIVMIQSPPQAVAVAQLVAQSVPSATLVVRLVELDYRLPAPSGPAIDGMAGSEAIELMGAVEDENDDVRLVDAAPQQQVVSPHSALLQLPPSAKVVFSSSAASFQITSAVVTGRQDLPLSFTGASDAQGRGGARGDHSLVAAVDAAARMPSDTTADEAQSLGRPRVPAVHSVSQLEPDVSGVMAFDDYTATPSAAAAAAVAAAAEEEEEERSDSARRRLVHDEIEMADVL